MVSVVKAALLSWGVDTHHSWPLRSPPCSPALMSRQRHSGGGVKQSTFCMVHRKTMITMGSPYFVWINTNEIISSWYLLDAVCVTPPTQVLEAEDPRPLPGAHGGGGRRRCARPRGPNRQRALASTGLRPCAGGGGGGGKPAAARGDARADGPARLDEGGAAMLSHPALFHAYNPYG
jgi:hypothetical protein